MGSLGKETYTVNSISAPDQPGIITKDKLKANTVLIYTVDCRLNEKRLIAVKNMSCTLQGLLLLKWGRRKSCSGFLRRPQNLTFTN